MALLNGVKSEKARAASRANGSKSRGPVSLEGKQRSSRNAFKDPLYTKVDRRTRDRMFEMGEDPALMERMERKLREAFQPSNAMEAAIVADLARLYRDKDLLESSVREAREERTLHLTRIRKLSGHCSVLIR